ncbi:MAG: flagellar basal body-associated FliL family protein [Nitrospinae bacterium]|nr:flagellar basal body-associated FliL family protein [Nitrospinota bacterium]
MAVEESHERAEGGGGEASEAPRKSKPKVVLLALVGAAVLALVGAGGFFAASILGGGNKAKLAKGEPAGAGEESAKEPKGGEGGRGEEGKKEGLSNIVPVDPIIVNLIGDDGRRLMKLTMQLAMATTAGATEAQGKMPQIKDSVITLLSSRTAEELLTPDGKSRLKEQVMTRVNSLLTGGAVKNVFFVEFIIQ